MWPCRRRGPRALAALRPLLCGVAVTILVGAALVGRADPPSTEHPDGLIYTSIQQWSGIELVFHIVAVDPRTGACQQIAEGGCDPRLSPDGRYLAYTKLNFLPERKRSGEVWVKPMSPGGDAYKVWVGDGEPQACWTRDSRHLLVCGYVRDATGTKPSEYSHWRVEVQTSEAEEVDLPSSVGIQDAAHASDRLLLKSVFAGQSLFTMLPDKSGRTKVSGRAMDGVGRFSPDDRRVLVVRYEDNVQRICTVDLDGRNVQVAYTETPETRAKDVGWSPDAKRISLVLMDWYTHEKPQRKTIGGAQSNERIAIVDVDGRNVHVLQLDRPVVSINGLDWR